MPLKDYLPPPPWEGPPAPRTATLGARLPSKGWLTKGQALTISVAIRDKDTWYHGTSMTNKEAIRQEGICSGRRGVWDVSQSGIYLTRDFEQAQRWALDAARKDGRFVAGIVYAISGKHLQGFSVRLDWNLFFSGEANDVFVLHPVCLDPEKLTIAAEGFHAVTRVKRFARAS